MSEEAPKIKANKSCDYVYLLQKSTIDVELNIFKYGKTTDVFRRFYGYPKNSELLYLKRVKNSHHVEKEIKRIFATIFKHEPAYGREYFSGNAKLMKRHIDEILEETEELIEEDLIEEIKEQYKNYLVINFDDDSQFSDNDENDNDELKYKTKCISQNKVPSNHKSSNSIKIKKTPAFQCEKCEQSFSTKQCLQGHITRNACKIPTVFCKYCKSGFTTETSMYRHMRKSCKIKKETDEKQLETNRLEKLENENKEIKNVHKNVWDRLEIVSNKIKELIASDNSNNLSLVKHGDEDMSKIDEETIVEILKQGSDALIQLICHVHFNQRFPEYHNAYIANMTNKYGLIFNGEKWILIEKDALIDPIYHNIKLHIKMYFKKFKHLLSTKEKKNLSKWLVDKTAEIEDKSKIKLVLYNNRDLPIKTNELLVTNSNIKISKSIKTIKTNNHILKIE